MAPIIVDTQWCSQNVSQSCNSSTASACLNLTCPDVWTSWNNSEFRQAMLDAHNAYRKTPFTNGSYGADMLEMQWDVQLEDVALRYIQKLCSNSEPLSHEQPTCRRVIDYDRVGQNLWTGWGTKYGDMLYSANRSMTYWYNEIVNATTEMMWPFTPESSHAKVGHYTQVMWSRSFAVGCAYIRIPDPKSTYRTWVACDYAKAGNLLYQNVFTPSDTLGSNCPSGSSRSSSSGLCQVNDIDTLRKAINLGRTG